MKTDEKSRSRRIQACTLLEKHADEVKSLFAEVLNAIGEALDAERVVLGRDDESLYLGLDHVTRIAAARLLNELVLSCRKAPVEEREKAPPMTLEELHQILKENAVERRRAGGEASAATNKPRRHWKSKNPKLEARNGNV